MILSHFVRRKTVYCTHPKSRAESVFKDGANRFEFKTETDPTTAVWDREREACKKRFLSDNDTRTEESARKTRG